MEPALTRAKTTVKSEIEKHIPHTIDRKLFILFWALVGVSMLIFGIFTGIKCADSYKNPGAQMSVSTQPPPFPIFAVCFNDPINAPTVIAIYAGASPYQLAPFNWTSWDYCDNGNCVCFQFNSPNAVQQDNGSVIVYASARYSNEASRSVAFFFVKPQGTGNFTPDTAESDFDDLNLPTGSFVAATWTVTQRVTTTSWVKGTTNTQTHYALIQQVEQLTPATTKSLLQYIASDHDSEACPNYDSTAACSGYNGYPGNCVSGNCEWTCTGSNDTIWVSYVCDGYEDCLNGADEMNCKVFNCSDGTSIPISGKCNGVDECLDGSDEKNCSWLPITIIGSVSPYSVDVTIISDSVTYSWDVALAAFKSVIEIALGVVAFFFPAYFLETVEPKRFRFLRQAQAPKEEGEPRSPERQPSQQKLTELTSPSKPNEEVEIAVQDS